MDTSVQTETVMNNLEIVKRNMEIVKHKSIEVAKMLESLKGQLNLSHIEKLEEIQSNWIEIKKNVETVKMLVSKV